MGGGASAIGVAFQALQIGTNVGGVLVAKIAIFLQSLVDDIFQLLWKVGIEADRRDGSAVENGLEDQRRSVSAEGQCPGRHLIEHDAEREQIGASVEFFALSLLRRHVGDSA